MTTEKTVQLLQLLESTCEQARQSLTNYASSGNYDQLVECYSLLTITRRLSYDIQSSIKRLSPPLPIDTQLNLIP